MFAPRRHRGNRAGLLVGRKAGPGESTGAEHVFKGGGEPQPSREWVDGLAVQQPSARWVGALLELKGDAYRPGLVHTDSIAAGAAGRVTAPPLFYAAPRGRAAVPGAAPSGAAARSATGSSSRDLMESF